MSQTNILIYYSYISLHLTFLIFIIEKLHYLTSPIESSHVAFVK